MGLRWQPFVVAAGLLAPPVVLAAAVWPASARDGSEDETATTLAVGEETDGTVSGDGAEGPDTTITGDLEAFQEPLGDEETELTILAIPGRVEQFVVGRFRIPGDAFSRPGGSGDVIERRDADGAATDAFPA